MPEHDYTVSTRECPACIAEAKEHGEWLDTLPDCTHCDGPCKVPDPPRKE